MDTDKVNLPETRQVVNHTPGPWAADNGDSELWGVFDGNGASIAYLGDSFSNERGGVVFRPSRDFDTDEANARLIAAAPDLLEACKMLKGKIEYMIEEQGLHHLDGDPFNILKAAIAKAEGRNAD